MAKLCLGWFGILSIGCSTLFGADPRWEDALRLLEESKPAQAIPLLEAWRHDADARGVRSPGLQHNLAVAYSRVEDWGPAVHALATSAALHSNPLYLTSALRNLSRTQHLLLIQDAVSSQWPFRLSLWVGRSLLVALTALGVWLLLFAPLSRSMARALALSGVLALLLAGLGFGIRAALPHFAVIQATKEGAPLYSERSKDPATKLTNLPAGTLVVLGELQGGSRALIRPFAGWVDESTLRLLD